MNPANQFQQADGASRNGRCGDLAASVHPDLAGRKLTDADFQALEARWIDQPVAEAAFLRRVDNFTGAELVGRKGGDYSGIAIPTFGPAPTIYAITVYGAIILITRPARTANCESSRNI